MKSFLLTALASAALANLARSENLLENGSFELPKVTGRTSAAEDGSLLQIAGPKTWASFLANVDTNGGALTVGITNEIARTGTQALFLDFKNVTASGRAAVLETALIVIKPAQNYRLSIWGRIDRKRPLALDERRAFLALKVQFFAADRKAEAGDPIAGAQLIPGLIHPGETHELIFTSGKWKESFAIFAAPAGAAFLKVTWTWSTPGNAGETDGVLYWDDAALEETAPEPAAEPDAEPAPKAAPEK